MKNIGVSSSGLLGCPFCGEEVEEWYEQEFEGALGEDYHAGCRYCDISFSSYSENEARSKWNTRAI